jgi:hypothetical protein
VSLIEFFQEIDRTWGAEKPAAKTRLAIIGCGALLLRTSYQRGTKDSDVFETTELTSTIQARLLAIAGHGTKLHTKHKLYVDIVGNGLPFLPHVPVWHEIPTLNESLTNLEIRALDVVDVVVSKLKRFGPNDVSDIDAMIQMGHVPHAALVERFRSAFEEFSFDARAADLPAYVANLNQVERDMLRVSETELDLESLRY